MKHLKIFDSYKSNTPQVGDYVICDEIADSSDDPLYKKTVEFELNNIGQIIKYIPSANYPYIVQYENPPDELSEFFSHGIILYNISNCRKMISNEIIYWSKDKEYLETIIKTMKFNI